MSLDYHVVYISHRWLLIFYSSLALFLLINKIYSDIIMCLHRGDKFVKLGCNLSHLSHLYIAGLDKFDRCHYLEYGTH